MCKFIEFYDSNIKKKVRSENSSHFLRFSDSQILRFSDFTMGVPAIAVGLSAISLLAMYSTRFKNPLKLCSRSRIQNSE